MNKISTTVVLAAIAVGMISLYIGCTTVYAQGSTTNISIVPNASTLGDKAFSPSPANIKVGTTVIWTNNDSTLHTVVSGDPATGSKKLFSPNEETTFLAKGKTVMHTFDKPGTFDYYCTLHPTMLGKVIVS